MIKLIYYLFTKCSTYAFGYWPQAFLSDGKLDWIHDLSIITLIALGVLALINFFGFFWKPFSIVWIPLLLLYITINSIITFAILFVIFNIFGGIGFCIGGIVLFVWYLIQAVNSGDNDPEDVSGMFGIYGWAKETAETIANFRTEKQVYELQYKELLKF